MYLLKVIGKDEYLGIDALNNIYNEKDPNKAKKFTKEKAEKILQNHSIPNWHKYKIHEHIQAPKNQIDFIEEEIASYDRNHQNSDAEKTMLSANIYNARGLTEQIYNAKLHIKGDIEYYNKQLMDVQKCITDVTHFMETITLHLADGKEIYDIAVLMIQLFQKRRMIKIQIEVLTQLNNELCGDFSKSLDETINSTKIYKPRYLDDMFETGVVPKFEDLDFKTQIK